MDKLEACPFCGATVILVKATTEGAGDWIQHQFDEDHYECGVEFSDFNLTGDLTTGWNHRTPSQELTDLQRRVGELETEGG